MHQAKHQEIEEKDGLNFKKIWFDTFKIHIYIFFTLKYFKVVFTVTKPYDKPTVIRSNLEVYKK